MQGGLIPAAAVVVVAMYFNTAAVPACSDATPCRPEAVSACIAGLLFAAALAGLINAGVAAWISSAFVLAVFGQDLADPTFASPPWIYVADLAFVALSFVAAATGPFRLPEDAAFEWLSGTPAQPVPDPGRLPGSGKGWRVAAGVTAVAAVVAATWGWHLQQRMDSRQDAARIVTAEVIEHVDEFIIRVRLPTEQLVEFGVRDQLDHPVGQRLGVYTDADGLRQLVSEPYDASGVLWLAVLAAGLALACRARAAESAAGLQRLFGQPQPATQVYVRVGPGTVAIYPGDARPGQDAIAEYDRWNSRPDPAAAADDGMWKSRARHDRHAGGGGGGAGGGGAGGDGDECPAEYREDDLVPTQPALLYGRPAPGLWCTVVLDGRPVIPAGPLSAGVDVPRFAPPGETRC
ncbi:MAG TPA: hypothetical protein VK453_09700 [Micromonosporaceae bacterium]|nr:hypothetical protein [Micromonosporaceae bacterium]